MDNTFVISGSHERCNILNGLARQVLQTMAFRIIRGAVAERKENQGKIVYMNKKSFDRPAEESKIWWDRKKYDSVPPRCLHAMYEPAYAVTIDCFQGRTVRNEYVILDCESLNRHGAYYTALTRAVTAEQCILAYF